MFVYKHPKIVCSNDRSIYYKKAVFGTFSGYCTEYCTEYCHHNINRVSMSKLRLPTSLFCQVEVSLRFVTLYLYFFAAPIRPRRLLSFAEERREVKKVYMIVKCCCYPEQGSVHARWCRPPWRWCRQRPRPRQYLDIRCLMLRWIRYLENIQFENIQFEYRCVVIIQTFLS